MNNPFLVMVAAALMLYGCGGGQEEAEVEVDGIVAVENEVLTEKDLENLIPESGGIGGTDAEKRLHIERWINTELLYQEALKRGLSNDPRIQSRLVNLEKEFLADHLVFLELRERTRVSGEEVADYFAEHENEYVNEYRVSHILVNSLEEAREVKELLAKNSFAWVANRYSVDPDAKRGGDLGYLTKGNMIPAFEKVIFDMKPGEVSDIVKSDFGYHVIKLIGSRQAFVKVDIDEVREHIENKLMIEKRERAYREFMESLRESADVRYLKGALAFGIEHPDSSVRVERAEDSLVGIPEE